MSIIQTYQTVSAVSSATSAASSGNYSWIQNFFEWIYGGIAEGVDQLLIWSAHTFAISWPNISTFWGYDNGGFLNHWKTALLFGFALSGIIFGLKGLQTILSLVTDDRNEKPNKIRDLLLNVWGIPFAYSIIFLIGVYVISLILGTQAHNLEHMTLQPPPTGATMVSLLGAISKSVLIIIAGVVVIIAIAITGFLYAFDFALSSVNFWLFAWLAPVVFFMSPLLGDFPKTFIQRMIMMPFEQYVRIIIIGFFGEIPFSITGMVLKLALLAIGRAPLKAFGIASASDAPVFASLGIAANALSTGASVGNFMKKR